MGRLESSLIDSFVKATKPAAPPKTESFLYGTVQSVDDVGDIPIANILFDGSDAPTPCEYSVQLVAGDRVTVMIKNRKPVVIANNTRPAVSFEYLEGNDALFKGRVEVVWYENDVNEQRAYLGDEDSQAPLSVKYASRPIGTLITAGAITLYDEETGRYATGTASSGWVNPSDARLKTDVNDCDPEIARNLRPVAFKFEKAQDEQHYGFIAQEVQELIPDAVSIGPKGYLGLNYTELIAPILALVQEQEKRINELERKVSDLEAERDQLSAYEKPLL